MATEASLSTQPGLRKSVQISKWLVEISIYIWMLISYLYDPQNFPPDHQSSSRQQSYVPTSNNSYLPSSQQEIPRKRDSLYRPQTHTHYSSGLTNSNVRNIQSMPQSNYGPSRRTSYSDSSRSGYNLAPTYYSDVPYQTNVYQPSTNLRQTSSYSTQTNQYRSTSQVEGQLSHTPITSTQGVNVQQSAQASDSHEPTQFSFTAHQHQQGYQNSKSMYHSPKAGMSCLCAIFDNTLTWLLTLKAFLRTPLLV